MTPTFRSATLADVPTLRRLAEEIWRDFYPAVIGEAQVEYMLPRMYGAAVIEDEIARGICWEVAVIGDEPIGFISVTPPESDGQAKLNKLYLQVDRHGLGFGQLFIDRACALARELGASSLWLQVNKNNLRAIRAYERAGFRREREAIFDIGGGFVMDDYLYSRVLG